MCDAFDRLYNQIRYENQKRQNEYFIEFCKMLKLLNFCGNYHCFCPGNENYCAYRNHSVYEKVAEYFKKRRQNVWRNDADDSLYPVVTKNCSRRFPAFVHFIKRAFHHKERRCKKVNHIAENKNCHSVPQKCFFESKKKRNSKNHSRNGVRYLRD